uniref:Uncharacterized protein n=1 Tax=Glossina pallidipes TaxID=7398 RepID=A0A1A9ZIT4_GLOPL
MNKKGSETIGLGINYCAAMPLPGKVDMKILSFHLQMPRGTYQNHDICKCEQEQELDEPFKSKKNTQVPFHIIKVDMTNDGFEETHQSQSRKYEMTKNFCVNLVATVVSFGILRRVSLKFYLASTFLFLEKYIKNKANA